MVSCTDDDDKDPNFMPPDIVMVGEMWSRNTRKIYPFLEPLWYMLRH